MSCHLLFPSRQGNDAPVSFVRWKHDSDGDKNRHPKTALIRNENSLFPCFLLFFKELSKKRRKRIRKHAKGRVCAYARERNTMISELCMSTHDALNEIFHIDPDNP